MLRPDHCTAPVGKECWECYQQIFRVTERRINRAVLLIKGRAAKLTNETESISKLDFAVRNLRDLHNSQWRDMVRDPFVFEIEEKPEKNSKANLNDLLADIGLI